MLMVFSKAQVHLLVQDDNNEVQHDSFGHMVILALVLALHDGTGIKMKPLHSLHQDNPNEGQHGFLVI